MICTPKVRHFRRCIFYGQKGTKAEKVCTEGNPAAKDAIENDLIKELDVYKNGNIVYLAHLNVWYTFEGGIQALDVLLKNKIINYTPFFVIIYQISL